MNHPFRRVILVTAVLLLALMAAPALAQSGVGGLGDTVESFFTEMEGVLQGIALAAVAVSMLTIGLIYTLSSWPPVAQYKANHPDLMQNLIIGMFLILFVAGGTLASLIAF